MFISILVAIIIVVVVSIILLVLIITTIAITLKVLSTEFFCATPGTSMPHRPLGRHAKATHVRALHTSTPT